MMNPAASDRARGYLAHGWSVVPVETGGKRPLVAWLEFQRRHATMEELQAWFDRWPDANLAIVTGAISGLAVLDIDARHGGRESLTDLETRHGALPPTVEAASGGGGRHCYFAHPGGIISNRVGIAPGIDLRGDGGLIIAPPSVHPSGRRYAWLAGRSPEEIPLAPVPPWLLRLVFPGAMRKRHSVGHWRTLVRQGVAEGERNNTIASLAGHLLSHGVDSHVVLDLLLAWNRQRARPPLADAEVAGVVDSILRLHERETGE